MAGVEGAIVPKVARWSIRGDAELHDASATVVSGNAAEAERPSFTRTCHDWKGPYPRKRPVNPTFTPGT
jgi:hypothetical protein